MQRRLLAVRIRLDDRLDRIRQREMPQKQLAGLDQQVARDRVFIVLLQQLRNIGASELLPELLIERRRWRRGRFGSAGSRQRRAFQPLACREAALTMLLATYQDLPREQAHGAFERLGPERKRTIWRLKSRLLVSCVEPRPNQTL